MGMADKRQKCMKSEYTYWFAVTGLGSLSEFSSRFGDASGIAEKDSKGSKTVCSKDKERTEKEKEEEKETKTEGYIGCHHIAEMRVQGNAACSKRECDE